ncbi:Hypothetical protein FKW44_022047 [Caligus rogercresseyi]|uniref:Uncharacterized protein n=1 Tax=Caligus rogercresseyi TaxID=217165 RepID=A0A7T8JWL6_CALRO|nr:Hypothetical protein FKW44_022047 [Caligus rogercresseyi]
MRTISRTTMTATTTAPLAQDPALGPPGAVEVVRAVTEASHAVDPEVTQGVDQEATPSVLRMDANEKKNIKS